MINILKYFFVAPLVGAFAGGLAWSLAGIADHQRFVNPSSFVVFVVVGVALVEGFAVYDSR